MGLFTSNKDRIMPGREFEALKRELRQEGLSHRDLEQVEEVAEAFLDDSGRYAGIDRAEKEKLFKILKDHRHTNHLSTGDLRTIGEELGLKDVKL